MDNPETLATLDTQDTGQRQTKQKMQHRKLNRAAVLTHPRTEEKTEATTKVK
jgi:hypothetical protein